MQGVGIGEIIINLYVLYGYTISFIGHPIRRVLFQYFQVVHRSHKDGSRLVVGRALCNIIYTVMWILSAGRRLLITVI